MSNIFRDSHIDVATDNSLGPRLSNIRDKTLSSESIFSVLPSNNAVDGIPISVYGKTLLNTTSLNTLRTALLSDNEEAIAYNGGDNLQEINFHTYASGQSAGASNLRFKITTAETIVNNPLKLNDNLFVDNIKRKTDNTDALSLGPTTMTLQKAMTIFRDSADKGYLRVQNSITNKSGYIDFMTGENDRVAYLGQGEENDLTKTGNFLYLGMENQCGFSINDGATSIFNVNLENDTIALNYPTTASTTLTANTSITTPEVIAQTFRSKQGDSEILFKNNAGTSNIRIIPGTTNFIQSTSNTLSFTKLNNSVEQIKIDHNDLAPHNTGTLISKYNISIRPPTGNLNFNLFKCPSNEQVSLYSHTNTDGGFVLQKGANDNGIKINMFHDGTYRPMYFNSANSSQMVIGTEAVQTDTERFIVNSTSRFKNGLTSDADINLVGTSKLHFDSNNYFANDASHNLNLFLNNNHNFVANTGNDKSSYEFKIDDNSVLKMTRDLTSNPALNITQVSSQILRVKDDAVAGGYVELERTGGSGVLAGYINYYNTSGRLFYTGFNTGSIGNPLHFFEDQCRSYTFKNSQGNIMKINSHTGSIGANTDYVEINRLDCPTINTTNLRFTGETTNAITLNEDEVRFKKPLYVEYANRKITLQAGATDNVIYNKASGLNLAYNIGYTVTGEVENITAPSLYTSKVLIDNAGIALKVSATTNALPSNILVASSSAITCFKDVNILGTSVKLNFNSNNYLQNDGSNNLNLYVNDNKNFVADTGNDVSIYDFKINSVSKLKITDTQTTISNNLQTPSIISSSNTATYQSRLDMDDLLATFVCRDGTGTEKSILIGSYSALVSNVQITANQGILMNNTFNCRDVIPTGDGTYDLGSSSQHFQDIYATNNVIDTSDRNKKKDIQPIQGGLETIMKLKPVSYKFINGKSGRTHTGFIAQECKDTYVKDWAGYVETEGQHFGLRYSQFISLNTQAIQELYGLIQGKPVKPPLVRQQAVDIQEHKCAGVYNLENDIEELVKDKEQLTIDLFALKTQNQKLEERVIQLENIDYHQQPVEPVKNNDVSALTHRVEILEEETLNMSENTNTTHIDILNSRLQLIENENKKMKLKLQKQTTLINKMLKALDMV